MSKRPLSVSVTWIFTGLNALIWLGLGAIIALNAHTALPDNPWVKGIMAVLSLGVGGTLLGLLILLIRHFRPAYYAALGFLMLTALLTIFDEVGWIDLVVLGTNLVPVALLIKDRTWYLPARTPG